MLSFFLIVAFLALSKSETVIPFTRNTPLYNCSLSYAIENMEINEDFRKAYPIVDKYDPATCNTVLDKFREEKYEYLKELYEVDFYYSYYSDCIIGKLRKFAAADLYILKLVYKLDEDLQGIRLQKARWEVLGPIEDKMELAEALCLPEKFFPDFFDSLYEDQDETVVEDATKEDLEANYCIANHLVVHKLHGIDKYDIKIDQNIKVEHKVCAKYLIEYKFSQLSFLEHTFQAAAKSTTPQQNACYHKVIKTSAYAEMIFMAGLLSEAELTEERKNEERQKFTEFMIGLYKDILNCDNIKD